MKADDLTKWLLGALLAAVVLLGGSTLKTVNDRFDRMETANDARFSRVEEKVDFVVSQYGKIAVIEGLTITTNQRIDRIEKALDHILQDSRR